MRRFAAGLLGLLAMALFATPQGFSVDPPAAAPPDPKALFAKQEQLARQFKEFVKDLLAVAQRLEKSERSEDKEKAKSLRKAIELAEEQSVESKFSTLVRALANANNISVPEMTKATNENEELVKVLRQIMAILLSDDEMNRLREERIRLAKLLEELKGIIREQGIQQSITEQGKGDKEKLARDQMELSKKTDDLAKKMGAKGDPKDGKGKDGKLGDPKDGKGKDGKDGKGDPKDGKGKDGKDGKGDPKDGKGKPADPKDGKGDPKDGKGGEPKDGKGGEPKDGKGGPPKDGGGGKPKDAPPPTPGGEQVKKAVPDQQDASENIEKNKKDEAVDKQEDAKKKLEEAQKELEKRLKQLREEELERLLANLEARCSRMLAMQKEVKNNTVSIEKAVQTNEDKKPNKENFQKSQVQADKEGLIIAEADKAIDLLRGEGSAVAFPQVFEETRKDMVRVRERLTSGTTNIDTQLIEDDIIKALEEMVAALKKAQQDLKKEGGGGGGGGGGPANQKLLDEIAELKMIRNMQKRVNDRTENYGKRAPGEQADDPQVVKEVKDLGQRQERLEEMLKDLASGKNK